MKKNRKIRDSNKILPSNTEQARAALVLKVEEGTKRAIKEYGEVFERLAESDKIGA